MRGSELNPSALPMSFGVKSRPSEKHQDTVIYMYSVAEVTYVNIYPRYIQVPVQYM